MTLALNAQAGPTGGAVVEGGGTIVQTGSNTTINQNTQQLSIDWQSFDIARDELVEFVQPNDAALALNRVVTNDASEIFGQLRANGQVVLINPNGILFGPGARVDVGSLVASGLDVEGGDGTTTLELAARAGALGQVINQGIINAATGGAVALVGKRVVNDGLIQARLGNVTLAGGREAVLTFDESGLLGVRVTQESLRQDLGLDASVRNNGSIVAAGGNIVLTAQASREVFSAAVNCGELGAIDAVEVHADGSFTLGGGALVDNRGTLNVSSNVAGTLDQADDVGAVGTVELMGSEVRHSGEIAAVRRAYESFNFYDSPDQDPAAVRLAALDSVSLAPDSRIVASSVTNAYSRPSRPGPAGDIDVTARQIEIGEGAVIEAKGAGGGSISLGDAATEYVYVDNGSSLNLYGHDVHGGTGGSIDIRATDAVQVYGQLHAGGGIGSSGGDVTLDSGGILALGARAYLGGGYSGDPEYPRPSGQLILRAPQLLISRDATPTTISEAALNSMAEILLEATDRIAVIDPVAVGDTSRESSVITYNITARAQNPTTHAATIDMDNLSLHTEYFHYLRVLTLQADGDIAMPWMGDIASSGESTRPVSVSATSTHGNVTQGRDVTPFGGTYQVTAAGDIRFVNGAVLDLAFPEALLGSNIDLVAGADIVLEVDSEGMPLYRGSMSITGRDVSINNRAGPLTSDVQVQADNLTITTPGDVTITAEVTGLTDLVGIDSGTWQLDGDLNRLRADLADSTLTVNDPNELVLDDMFLVSSTASINAGDAGATLSQAPGSQIRLRDSAVTVSADNLDLGAEGSASIALVGGTNQFEGLFSDSLTLGGTLRAATGADRFHFTGSAGDNQVQTLAGASLTAPAAVAIEIDVGAGDDTLSFDGAGRYRVTTGTGADRIAVESAAVTVTATDFDREEDVWVDPDQ